MSCKEKIIQGFPGELQYTMQGLLNVFAVTPNSWGALMHNPGPTEYLPSDSSQRWSISAH